MQGEAQIDGLLDDWREVTGLITQDHAHLLSGKAWDGPDDLSFVTKCNYDDKHLFLAINVRDDRLVRTKKATPKEDYVEVLFARGQRLTVYPADPQADLPHVVRWGKGKGPAPAGIEVAESLPKRREEFGDEVHHTNFTPCTSSRGPLLAPANTFSWSLYLSSAPLTARSSAGVGTGFSMKCTPASSTPWWAIALSV